MASVSLAFPGFQCEPAALCVSNKRTQNAADKKKKETLLSAELGKYLDKRVRVKFQGGREGTKRCALASCLAVYTYPTCIQLRGY